MTAHILITLAAMLIAATVSGLYFTIRARRKVTYMLDALEDGETNFRFREDRGRDRKFNRTLNRLRRIFEKEQKALRAQEIFYGKLLGQVQTGIIVTGDTDGRIIYCNSKSLAMLGLPSLDNMRHLSRTRPELAQIFRHMTAGNETKTRLYNESSCMTVSITASSARIGENSVTIIAMNDISNEMEENEADSWTRLIRVMTHEIMNTVTPIASLSESLSGYIGSGDESTGGKAMPGEAAGGQYGRIKDGLDTIAASARGMIRFVNSYRDLTHIPHPVKSAFYLKKLIDCTFSLTAEQMSSAGVQCSYSELSDDIILYADKDQISQIVINLMKNAVQAGADRIDITSEIDGSGNIIIDIANNGEPISAESRDEIFIPFFTTRPEGCGIGLSLSRQIMRLHNGAIRLSRSDSSSTVFTLIFK